MKTLIKEFVTSASAVSSFTERKIRWYCYIV